MSETEKPRREDKVSKTNILIPVRTDSLAYVTQNPETQAITINFYTSNFSPKVDKPVQTDSSYTELMPKLSSILHKRKVETESQEITDEDPPIVLQKIPKVSVPLHETLLSKFMNSRKASENNPAIRVVSDLERKKLEAEFKATEELAKIQQNVIEKRLALELASLQDSKNSPRKRPVPQFQQPSEEQQAIEELKKKQKLLESLILNHDLDPKQENQPRVLLLGPPPPTKLPVVENPKIFKADSSGLTPESSELNPLRNLLEKKLNLDKKSLSKTSFLKNSSILTKSRSQERRNIAYPSGRNFRNSNVPNFASEQPGCSPQALRRHSGRLIWKTIFLKIKNKVSHRFSKPPEEWDEEEDEEEEEEEKKPKVRCETPK